MLQPTLRALQSFVAATAALTILVPLPVAHAAQPTGPVVESVLDATEQRAVHAAMVTDSHSVPDGAGPRGEHDIEPFVLVAASWTDANGNAHSDHADNDARPRVRVRDLQGWSDWILLNDGDTTGGPAAPEHTSEPIWVGAADAYELEVPGGENLRIHVVRPDPTTDADPGTGPSDRDSSLAAADTGGPPPLRSRATWGPRPPKRLWDAVPEVRAAMIHHTASTNSYSPAQVPAMLRAIQAFHMDGNGWIDIGYNFLVDRFGTIWEGRGGGTNLAIAGTHTGGYNYGSVGIGVLGDFTSAAVPAPVLGAVADVVAWKLWLSGSDPAVPVLLWPYTDQLYPAGVARPFSRVVGHGDLNQTGCPGRLRLELPRLRVLVEQRYRARNGSGQVVEAASSATPPAGAVAQRGDFDGDGRDDILWYRDGGSTATIWPGAEGGFGPGRTESVTPGLQPVVGDLDGDGTDDVLWWSAAELVTGETWMLSLGGAIRRAPLGGVPSAYRPLLFDPDGDGDDDIIWYEQATGATWLWMSLGPVGYRGRWLAPFPGRDLVAADLDGDSRDDLVWFDGGGDEVWRFGDATSWVVSYHDISGPASVTVGDPDGDGAEELLVAAGGSIELRSGLAMSRGPTLPWRPGSALITADGDGGGADELWMRWPGGLISRWHVSERGFVWAQSISGAPGDVPTRLDANGDGRHDLLWAGPAGPSVRLWLGS